MVVATISLIVLTCVAFLVPVPYVTMSPGDRVQHARRRSTGKPMFTFGEDVKTYPTTGSLDFTTVSVRRRRRAALAGRGGRGVLRRRQGRRPQGPDLSRQRDRRAVHRRVGRPAVGLQGLLARRRAARCGLHRHRTAVRSPASSRAAPRAKLLKAGDVFTAVDGTKVTTPDQVVKAVGTHKPGDDRTPDGRAQGQAAGRPDRDARRPQGQERPAHRHHDRRDVHVPDQDRQQRRPQHRRTERRHDVRARDLRQADPGLADRRQEDRRHRRDDRPTARSARSAASGRRWPAPPTTARRSSWSRPPTAPRPPTATTTGSSSSRSRRSKDAISSLEALAKDPDAKVPSCS